MSPSRDNSTSWTSRFVRYTGGGPPLPCPSHIKEKFNPFCELSVPCTIPLFTESIQVGLKANIMLNLYLVIIIASILIAAAWARPATQDVQDDVEGRTIMKEKGSVSESSFTVDVSFNLNVTGVTYQGQRKCCGIFPGCLVHPCGDDLVYWKQSECRSVRLRKGN